MTRATITGKEHRLFVPLKLGPYEAFVRGTKTWELRLCRRQWTDRHIWPTRRVELRCGYSIGRSLWGRISEVRQASRLSRIFDVVDFREIVPAASNKSEAAELAARVLGATKAPVIAFRIEIDGRAA